MNTYQVVAEFVSNTEPRYTLVGLMEYGSQAYGLSTESSDTDVMAVVEKDVENYFGLSYSDKVFNTTELSDKLSVQFMDVRQYFTLCQKSNFTLYAGLRNSVQHDSLLDVDYTKFSLRRLAHHLLGLIDNKYQRAYMSAYSSLLVSYLMQNNTHPELLDWEYLAENTVNVAPALLEVLYLKRNGIKDVNKTFDKPFSHEEVNILPDNELDMSTNWMNYVKQRLMRKLK